MFVICNSSHGNKKMCKTNLVVNFIDIELCIFNHISMDIRRKWSMMAPTTDKETYALYLVLVRTSINITNINIAHMPSKAQREISYNDGALSC